MYTGKIEWGSKRNIKTFIDYQEKQTTNIVKRRKMCKTAKPPWVYNEEFINDIKTNIKWSKDW